MLIKRPADILSSEITPEKVYLNRRQLLAAMPAMLLAPQTATRKSKYDATDTPTPLADVTTYNNYYEFGTGKEEPAINAKNFKMRPWTIKVEGEVKKPATYAIDDLLKGITMEDRIYRMRCVEAWSMVIPWHGFPLATLINKLEPTPKAKYIEFQTLLDPSQMREQRDTSWAWPYTEGLRMDEAMNELTMLAVGVYGKPGPAQNGAPLRLVTPWKYGFKGVKAIARIRFTETQPTTFWMAMGPREYGFYANVNPSVAHPRWSQATERRLGVGLIAQLRGDNVRETQMFNGYTSYVSHMYAGMDLRKNF